MEDYQAHNVGGKSAVDVQQATDDHILKRLNKKVNGLDRLIGQTPTIQNQGDLIKPDGTIAKDNEDIRLVEQRPLRTPRGVIEYKEATPNENFPIKIPLQSVKYDIESFMEAVDTTFNSYLKGFEQTDLPEEVTINVLDNPSEPQIEVETRFVDSRDNETDEEEVEDPPTATEQFGDKFELKTEFNSAGDLTGVAGMIFIVWKGVRYRCNNGSTQGDDNSIGGSPVHHFDGGVNPPPVKGLTNTREGRNLEVFMKDRDMTYDDIDIVPKAEITTETTAIERLVVSNDLDDVEWGPAEKDGCQYNTNEVDLNLGDGRVTFEKGDLIRPAGFDDDDLSDYDKAFLPDMSSRWTEYHPEETQKPAKRSQIYTPTGNEFTTKQWEGELIRGYTGGLKGGYFMVCRGEVRKYTGGLAFYATVKKLPSSVEANTAENNYDEYHNRTYTAMDWSQIRYLGYPASSMVTKATLDGSERVKISQHSDGAGWNYELEVGKKYHANARRSHRHGNSTHSHYARAAGHIRLSNWTENSLTSIFIPKGIKVRLRTGIPDSPFFSPGREKWIIGDDYRINFGRGDNDDYDTIEVYEHNGGTRGLRAGGAELTRDRYKKYIAEDSFYRKSHLAPYNKLFEG